MRRSRTTAAFLTVEASVCIAVLGLASMIAVQIHQEATVWPLRQSVADETEVLMNEMWAAPIQQPCGLAHWDTGNSVWIADNEPLDECWYIDGSGNDIAPGVIAGHEDEGWRIVYEHPSSGSTRTLPPAWRDVWGDWLDRNVAELAVADFLTVWDVESGTQEPMCGSTNFEVTHLEPPSHLVARSTRAVRLTRLENNTVDRRVSHGAFVTATDFDDLEDTLASATPPLMLMAPPAPPLVSTPVAGVVSTALLPTEACQPNI